MAIRTFVPATAPNTDSHLTPEQVEALGAELDALRAEVMDSLGEADARYIHKVIKAQRGLEVAGRGALLFSLFPPAWILGTAALSAAKILDNMEIGHNILHGQWDWMRDPKIHSTTWEWDHATPAESWKRSHNYEHHTFTNVRGKDRDLGYSIMRVTEEQEWKPSDMFQLFTNMGLSLIFEWGIAMYDLELDRVQSGEKSKEQLRAELKTMWRKGRKQLAKDYLLFPLLSGPGFLQTAAANLTANVIRNIWSHAVIFCGHFPDDTETFEEERLEGDDRQPEPPDRAPPVPGHAQQPLPPDRPAGPGDLPALRPHLHRGPAAPPVRPGAAQAGQAVLPRPQEGPRHRAAAGPRPGLRARPPRRLGACGARAWKPVP
jgi:fatty acid desaturase